MSDHRITTAIRRKYDSLEPLLNERARRQWAAAEARELGHGGISTVATAIGMARDTIRAGLREIKERTKLPQAPLSPRLRRVGGGRKRLIRTDPGLLSALETLIEPQPSKDPAPPLRWTCLSTLELAAKLGPLGQSISARTVATVLHREGYNLQASRRVREAGTRSARSAQMARINELAKDFLRQSKPVLVVDLFVGDETDNQRFVHVGVDDNTAPFVAASLVRWWQRMGRRRHSRAEEALIVADWAASDASGVGAWIADVQRLADVTSLKLTVCHLPPATHRWANIGQELICRSEAKRQARLSAPCQAVVRSNVADASAKKGSVTEILDTGAFRTEAGTDAGRKELPTIKPSTARGEWNLSVLPRSAK